MDSCSEISNFLFVYLFVSAKLLKLNIWWLLS